MWAWTTVAGAAVVQAGVAAVSAITGLARNGIGRVPTSRMPPSEQDGPPKEQGSLETSCIKNYDN